MTLAVDLRGHGAGRHADLATTRMADYADDVTQAVAGLAQPPVLVGWSMGGLVAMMVAADGHATACVALAPSAPSRRYNPDVPLREGVYGPEAYGIVDRDPWHQPAMPDLDEEERRFALAALGPESALARDERQAGIVIARMPCPLLIVTGTLDQHWPRTRYADLSIAAAFMDVEASHWGLVLRRECVEQLAPMIFDWATGPPAA